MTLAIDLDVHKMNLIPHKTKLGSIDDRGRGTDT
jgi:hypothetical protein